MAGSALAVAFVALVCQFGLVQWKSSEMLLLHATLMSVVILATTLLGDERGAFDIRQPWAVLMVFHLPFWIIGSFKTVLDPEQRLGWITGAEAQMPLAMLLVSTGFMCISFGYRFGVTRLAHTSSTEEKPKEWDCSRMVPLTVVAYIIVWPVRYFYYQEFLAVGYSEMMLQGAPPAYMRTFDGLIPRFLLLVVWAVYYSNPAWRKLLWLGLVLTVGELTWAVIIGSSKTLFFLPIFIPVVPYIILKRKIPVLRVVFSAAILVLVAYPYATTLREVYYQINGPGRAEARQVAFAQGWFWSAPSQEGLQLYANQVLDRSGGMGALCQLLQFQQNGDLDLKGTFYIRSLQGLVPRVLWPGKPILLEGVYFSAYLQGERGIDSIDTSTISGSVAPTLFGSFFWNLGWPGLVLSSIALGILSGLVFRFLKRQDYFSPSAFLYYSVFLTLLETTESEVVKFPSSLAWELMGAWGAIRFLGWNRTDNLPPQNSPEARRLAAARRRIRGRQVERLPEAEKPAAPAGNGGASVLPS